MHGNRGSEGRYSVSPQQPPCCCLYKQNMPDSLHVHFFFGVLSLVYAVTKERKGESTARKDVSARTRKNPTQPASHHCSPTHATSRATCKTPHPCPIRTTTLAPWCRYMQCLTGVPQQVLDSSSSQEPLQCYGKHDTLPLYHDAWTCGGERQSGHSSHAADRDIGGLKLVVEASGFHVWCAQVRVTARKVYAPPCTYPRCWCCCTQY